MEDKREVYYDINEEINNPYGIRKSNFSRSDITDEFGNLSIYKVEQMLSTIRHIFQVTAESSF